MYKCNLYVLSYENTVDDWIVRSMNVALPLYQLWDLVTIWVTVKWSANLCNDWIDFEMKFCQLFKPYYTYKCEIKKYRRVLILLAFLPVTFLGSMFAVEVVIYFRRIRSEENQNTLQDFLYSNIVRFLPTPFIVFNLVIEDIKALLIYKTLREAYQNLRRGVETEAETWNHGNPGPVGEIRISKWTLILLDIRKQVKATGELQSLQQIAILIHTIIISTESLFIIIKGTMVGQITKHVLICGGVAFLYAVRLIAKIVSAENITEEVKK